jgi:hypothetical protein
LPFSLAACASACAIRFVKSSALVALSPDERRSAGRGLQIVEQLADWSERVVDGRREVRAELVL